MAPAIPSFAANETAAVDNRMTFAPALFPGWGKMRDVVPVKYQLPGTSGLEITVEKGKNVYNFDLFSK